MTHLEPPTRILDAVTATRLVQAWRLKSDRVVFTNGVFDILHRGHVSYLQEAAAWGIALWWASTAMLP
jgi:D-beta-D-heptose 7-phosphate kinase/D-beta-D-heptose 1-phosphate adenosyltransferase